MIIDITQRTKIGRVYRGSSEPLKVETVKRQSSSGREYTYEDRRIRCISCKDTSRILIKIKLIILNTIYLNKIVFRI